MTNINKRYNITSTKKNVSLKNKVMNREEILEKEFDEVEKKYAKKRQFIYFITLIAIILVIIYQFAGFFVPESKAVNELQVQGYSNIQIIDRAWLTIYWRGGAADDVVRFQAKADNPIGKNVEVYVYSGWPFKGATIRSK